METDRKRGNETLREAFYIMDSFTQSILTAAMKDENAPAKALAHFMFREIVEDIHAAGKITDAEMEYPEP